MANLEDDPEFQSGLRMIAALAQFIWPRLQFDKYEKIIGIAESERFRNELVTILCFYRLGATVQAKQVAFERFERTRRRKERKKKIRYARKDAKEIEKLLARPGGDRAYLHGLLSTARMESIIEQRMGAEDTASSGPRMQQADRTFIRGMAEVFKEHAGKKPTLVTGHEITGPFADLLLRVHDDFRKISLKIDKELKETVTPALSLNILRLAKSLKLNKES
jgi:hypothetical protein